MSQASSAALGSRRRTQRLCDGGPTRIESIDPADGARGVFCDAYVAARLSAPADPASVCSQTFRIEDHEGIVPARLRVTADRLILIWMAERPLAAGVEHIVRAEGLRDAQGRAVAAHCSRFIPCDLTSTDWPP